MPRSLLCSVESHDHAPPRGHIPEPKPRTPAHTKRHVVPIAHAPPGGVRSRRAVTGSGTGQHTVLAGTARQNSPAGRRTAPRTEPRNLNLASSAAQRRVSGPGSALSPGTSPPASRAGRAAAACSRELQTLAGSDPRVPPARDFEAGENPRENHALPKSPLGNAVGDALKWAKWLPAIATPGRKDRAPSSNRAHGRPHNAWVVAPKEGQSDAFESGSSPDLQRLPQELDRLKKRRARSQG